MRARIQRQGVQFNQESVKTESGQTPKRDHAFAWVDADLADDPEAAAPRAWITADTAAALPGLMRKLPHYHRYSYLAFAGTEPQNTLKGRWIVKDSPLSANLAPGSQRAQLSTQNPLIE